MHDMPEHTMMPVNADGQGPVPESEAAAYACWCGKDCGLLQHVYSQSGGRMCEEMAAEGLTAPEIDHPTIPGFCPLSHAYTVGLMRLLLDTEGEDNG